jgi:hypothetical protein
MEPGTVLVKEAKARTICRPSDEEYCISETEIATRVTRYTEFENVKHNKRGPDLHETEWGGTEDCQIIARWCKRDVAILHTKTDRCTVVQRNREECGWIGNTQRGQNCIYLIFDGIHHNALKLNGEQTQPENNTMNVRSDKNKSV